MQLAMDSSTGGMQRVKVYRLNTEGMWDDKGTGSVSVEYMEVSSSLPSRTVGAGCPYCHRGCASVES